MGRISLLIVNLKCDNYLARRADRRRRRNDPKYRKECEERALKKFHEKELLWLEAETLPPGEKEKFMKEHGLYYRVCP